MNIMVQTTGEDESSLNGDSKILNRKLANSTRCILLKLIHNKELWFLAYQYSILISCNTENKLRGDDPYFLWHESRRQYKHIKIWGLRVYIIN